MLVGKDRTPFEQSRPAAFRRALLLGATTLGLVLASWLWWGAASTGRAAGPALLDQCNEAQKAQLGPAHCYFTDVALRDQTGEEKRFYSDLLKGKVVVISSFFTGCLNSCPIVNATLADLQDDLGARFGSEIQFLSITSDPVLDTPEILAGYARRMGAQPGWHFLTGDHRNVAVANHKLGFYVEEPSQHVNIIIVGNEATGLWKKVPSATGLSELGRIVSDVFHDRAGVN